MNQRKWTTTLAAALLSVLTWAGCGQFTNKPKSPMSSAKEAAIKAAEMDLLKAAPTEWKAFVKARNDRNAAVLKLLSTQEAVTAAAPKEWKAFRNAQKKPGNVVYTIIQEDPGAKARKSKALSALETAAPREWTAHLRAIRALDAQFIPYTTARRSAHRRRAGGMGNVLQRGRSKG